MPRGQLDPVVQHLRQVAGLPATAELTDAQLVDRYVSCRDRDAFATLVARHGRLVRSVCRHVLHQQQDIDDAFQVAFLVFASRAASIRKTTSLASWLHGVAYRTAMNARRAQMRRTKMHKHASERCTLQPVTEAALREVQAILDSEVNRLPPKYRAPFVLCCLEGRSRAEAAKELGWNQGTLSGRLAQARKELRRRLTRRGVALSAALCAAELSRTGQAAAVQTALVNCTLKAALSLAADQAAAADLMSAEVAGLLKGVLQSMFIAKVKIATAVLLTVGLLTGAGFLASRIFASGGLVSDSLVQSPDHPAPLSKRPLTNSMQARADTPQAPQERRAAQPPVKLSGRILDPQGKPLAGARLLLVGKAARPVDLGASAADGRFAVQVPGEATQGHFLAARAPGAGIDFVRIDGLDPARPLELRLVKDHVIRGRIVDTQGKPVAGVQVGVSHLDAFDAHSVDSFLAAWTNRMISWQWPGGDKALWQESGVIAAATTDADGRFALAGAGAERVVSLRVSGAGTADAELRVVNRQGFNPTPYNETTRKQRPIIVSGPDRDAPALYGPDLVFVVDPGKVIRGVVREADTGKPSPGVEVHCQGLKALTDAAGRYEIRGLARASSYTLWVRTDLAAGRLGRQLTVPDTSSYAPVTADIAVARVAQTVVVTGRIIDSRTGKGVRGDVHLGILADNKFARAHPELDYIDSVSTAEDGIFRIVAIPGSMLLMGGVDYEWTPNGQAVRCLKYKPATPDAKYPQYFPSDHPGSYMSVDGGFRLLQGNFCKVLQIEPGAAVVKQDIIVEPASTITVKIQDAKGHPLAGTFVEEAGRAYALEGPIRTETDSWLAQGVAESGKPRRLIFYEASKKLFATLMLQGNEKAPVVAQLLSCRHARAGFSCRAGAGPKRRCPTRSSRDSAWVASRLCSQTRASPSNLVTPTFFGHRLSYPAYIALYTTFVESVPSWAWFKSWDVRVTPERSRVCVTQRNAIH